RGQSDSNGQQLRLRGSFTDRRYDRGHLRFRHRGNAILTLRMILPSMILPPLPFPAPTAPLRFPCARHPVPPLPPNSHFLVFSFPASLFSVVAQPPPYFYGQTFFVLPHLLKLAQKILKPMT